MSNDPAEFMRFVGHFHPLLVHLPIGFLVLLAALEGLALHPRWRHLTAASGVTLVLAVPAAAASAACGWLLARTGGYDAALLERHQWGGFAIVPVLLLVLVAHRRGRRRLYLAGLAASLALVGFTGHVGGSLTHGRGFLTRHAPRFLRTLLGEAPAPPSPPGATPAGNAAGTPTDPPVFAAFVQPILNDYCVSCHGPDKAKGGLRLDSHEALARGGDTGPGIVPGRADESLLIQRLRLPESDDDRMPPDGKPQPSAADRLLLEWWINAGAVPDQGARNLGAPEPVLRALESRAQTGKE